MKARKPNTDQEAELRVYVNDEDEPCAEYVLSTEIKQPDLVECFIPIKPNDTIAIKGHFTGSILNAAFDFLADGAFLADSRTDEKDHGRVKYHKKRKLEFTSFINTPHPPRWTSIEMPRDSWDGMLRVKELDPATVSNLEKFEIPIEASKDPGVGSFQVVVSVNVETEHQFTPNKPFYTVGAWKDQDQKVVRQSGIDPEHEVRFGKSSHDKISQKRAHKHRRHWEGTRFGDKPWARFIFYYRTPTAINKAGCIARPDTWQALTPSNPRSFEEVRATPGRLSQKQQLFDNDAKSTSPIFNLLGGTSKTAARPTVKDNTTRNAFVGEKPRPAPMFPKRLGGTLKLPKPEDKQSFIAGTEVQGQENNFDTSAKQNATNVQHDTAGGSFTMGLGAEFSNTDGLEPIMPPGLFDDNDEPPRAFRGSQHSAQEPFSGFDAPLTFGAEPQSAKTSLAAADVNATSTAQPAKHVSSPKQSGSAASAKDLARLPAINNIRFSIPTTGADRHAIEAVFNSRGPYERQDQALEEFWRRVESIAVLDNADGRWYKNIDFEARQQIDPQLRKESAIAYRSHADPLAGTPSTPAETTSVEIDESGGRVRQPSMVNKSTARDQSLASRMGTPNSHDGDASRKRPTSTTPSTSGDTPARKKQRSAIAEEKRRLEAARARNAALKREAEARAERKRQREEFERQKEEEDRQMLQQLQMEADALNQENEMLELQNAQDADAEADAEAEVDYEQDWSEAERESEEE